MLAKMPKTSLPFGVLVSTPSCSDELLPASPNGHVCLWKLRRAPEFRVSLHARERFYEGVVNNMGCPFV
jgi:hypothetical protein